jgi:hypothetical protein
LGPELIVVDACVASRRAAVHVLETLLGRSVTELPQHPEDGPESVTDYLSAAVGRSRVLIRIDDPLQTDHPFGWQVVLELTIREQLDVRPVLLSAIPLKGLTQLTAAELATLGFRTFLVPVVLTDLLDALADISHE